MLFYYSSQRYAHAYHIPQYGRVSHKWELQFRKSGLGSDKEVIGEKPTCRSDIEGARKKTLVKDFVDLDTLINIDNDLVTSELRCLDDVIADVTTTDKMEEEEEADKPHPLASGPSLHSPKCFQTVWTIAEWGTHFLIIGGANFHQ